MSELELIIQAEKELSKFKEEEKELDEKFDKIRNEFKNIMTLIFLDRINNDPDKEIKVNYETVNYNDKEYITCETHFRLFKKIFVIDYDDFDKIKYMNWFLTNGYVTTSIRNQTGKHENLITLYLHNLIMDKLTFDGKGQTTTIDHINRNPLDNRKENLHLINQSEQNFNQNRKVRTVNLPDDCHIKRNELPRSVGYAKARGIHGEYFEVWLPNFNKADLRWFSSRDKTLSLRFKMEQTKKYLRYLQNKYPDEFNKRHIETEYNEDEIKLIDSYNAIIKLSKFYDKNMEVKYDQTNYLKEDLTHLTEEEIKLLNNMNFDVNNNKRKIKNNLPENCGITSDMIPKYCYFSPKRMDRKYIRGACFVIDKHPKLEKRGWSTNTSDDYTIKEKFEHLLSKLKEVEAQN